jgi:hypothetical protein
MFVTPNTVPGSQTRLVVEDATGERNCVVFNYALAAAGIPDLFVKTGLEGAEQLVWHMQPVAGQEGWGIGQVAAKHRVVFEAVEGEDLAGYVAIDEVILFIVTA